MLNLGVKRLLLHYFPNHFIILQKRFLNNTHSQSSSSLSSFTVKFLTNSCGLPLEKALSASQKFQLNENKSHKHQSVLFLLRSFHFSDTHITKLLIQFPHVLQSDVNNTLKPKLQFLADYGFVGPLLPDIITSNPEILFRSLSNCIKPTFEFLEKYVQTNDKVVVAAKRSPRLVTFDLKGTMQPNIEFLSSVGVTTTTIAKEIVKQPRTLMMSLDKIVNAVETAKELGLKPSAPMFLQAIRVMLSMSDSTWERKMQMIKSLGWSEEEIMSVFKRAPLSLAGSEEKIRGIMDFLVNTMKLNPVDIAVYPQLLMFGLNRRIHPRYNVIKVLKSKELLKKNKKLVWIFMMTEKDFLKFFVDKHLDKVSNLMEIYRGTINGDKINIQLH